MTTHLMLDIETAGTRPGAVVLSVALVRFTDEASVSVNLSVPDQVALGLEQDAATLEWWGQQDPAAWAAATQNPLPLTSALPYLLQWIAWAGPDPLIWCHGASFDVPLLGEVYRRAGYKDAPCPFWSIRDTRTLYDLAGVNVKDYAVPPPHIALNDAIAQTRAANAALAILARAHQTQPQATWRRYFHHPESGSVFFTDDGSFPNGDGHVEEITGGEYFDLARQYGVAA